MGIEAVSPLSTELRLRFSPSASLETGLRELTQTDHSEIGLFLTNYVAVSRHRKSADERLLDDFSRHLERDLGREVLTLVPHLELRRNRHLGLRALFSFEQHAKWYETMMEEFQALHESLAGSTTNLPIDNERLYVDFPHVDVSDDNLAYYAGKLEAKLRHPGYRDRMKAEHPRLVLRDRVVGAVSP